MQWDGLFADFGLSALDSLLPDVPAGGVPGAAPTWDGGRGRAVQAQSHAPPAATERAVSSWRPPAVRDTRASSRQQQAPAPPQAQMDFPPQREDDSKGEDEGVAQRLRRKRRAPARISDDVVGGEGGGGSDLEEDDDSDLKSGDRKRKSRREKARRDSINRLFAELSVLCDPHKPSKRDRLEILNEAVQEMRRLQDFVSNRRNSGGNGAGNGAGQHSVGDAGVYKRGGGYVDERSFKNYPFGSMPICE